MSEASLDALLVNVYNAAARRRYVGVRCCRRLQRALPTETRSRVERLKAKVEPL